MIIYKSNIFVIERNNQTSKIESKKGKKKRKRKREKKGNKEQKGKKSFNYY